MDRRPILIGTALAFWLRETLRGERTISLDTDWLCRRPLTAAIARLVQGVRTFGEAASNSRATAVAHLWTLTQRPTSALDIGSEPRSEDYDPYRFSTPIGATVFWIVVYFVLVAVVALWMR